jgi:hypothetical protein
LKIAVLAVELAPGSTPILVGRGTMGPAIKATRTAASSDPAQVRMSQHHATQWCLPCFFGGK